MNSVSGSVLSPFNEAPIHESGKFCDAIDLAQYGLPSMRPRFMNRGSIWTPIRKVKLLCPFNEAPIHESGKSCGDSRA